MGKPRKGKEVRINSSIRLEPEIKKQLIRDFTTVQNFVDWGIEKYLSYKKYLKTKGIS